MENRKKMLIALSAIIGFLPVDYEFRDVFFLQIRDGHRLSCDFVLMRHFRHQLLQLYLLGYNQLDQLFNPLA